MYALYINDSYILLEELLLSDKIKWLMSLPPQEFVQDSFRYWWQIITNIKFYAAICWRDIVINVQIFSRATKGTHTDDTISLLFPCEVEQGYTTKLGGR
jgi:hypothetical protein